MLNNKINIDKLSNKISELNDEIRRIDDLQGSLHRIKATDRNTLCKEMERLNNTKNLLELRRQVLSDIRSCIK